MIAMVHHSDKVRERGYHGAFGGTSDTLHDSMDPKANC
jgi:hypothetical protein